MKSIEINIINDCINEKLIKIKILVKKKSTIIKNKIYTGIYNLKSLFKRILIFVLDCFYFEIKSLKKEISRLKHTTS
jgi:hypothetical protein